MTIVKRRSLYTVATVDMCNHNVLNLEGSDTPVLYLANKVKLYIECTVRWRQFLDKIHGQRQFWGGHNNFKDEDNFRTKFTNRGNFGGGGGHNNFKFGDNFRTKFTNRGNFGTNKAIVNSQHTFTYPSVLYKYLTFL